MLVFVLVYITVCPFQFCNHLDDKKRSGCFDLIVFLISCYLYYGMWLFFTVPLASLQCVIVVFLDHTHLLFDHVPTAIRINFN